jgi:nucleotide-binding universal stress UspA family protein
MKNILIALDYDPSAEKIAEAGYALAKAIGAKVTLIHVIADSAYYSTLEYSPVMGYTGSVHPI